MIKWPHAPLHLLDDQGTFMVTGGTYMREHLFDTDEKKDYLQETLLSIAEQFDWMLQAWAVLSNHYHFIAFPNGDPKTLRDLISKLHAVTARQINKLDNAPGRKVWFQYWDSRITYQKSYYARLNYVNNNPVRHGAINVSLKYPWCSAAWFAKTAERSFAETVAGFKIDSVNVPHDF